MKIVEIVVCDQNCIIITIKGVKLNPDKKKKMFKR